MGVETEDAIAAKLLGASLYDEGSGLGSMGNAEQLENFK